MRRILLIALVLTTTGCGAAALIPFLEPYISPLIDKVVEYVVGETPEAEFLQDVIDNPDDAAEIIWQQANSSTLNPQSKYVLGAEDSSGVVQRIVGLTFRDSTLHNLNWTDPDTVLDSD